MSVRQILRLALVLLALTTLSPLVLAQPGRPGRPGQPFQPGRPGQPGQPFQPGPSGPGNADAAGCAACGVFGVIILVVSVVMTILWVFVAIWVAKDAKARGMDNVALWVVLIIFTTWIGLIIYIVARPQGTLKSCRECGGKRLRESRRCPHCRAA